MSYQFQKKVKYTTLFLVSFMPFSIKAFADLEKREGTVKSLSIKYKGLAEKRQQAINETRKFESGAQQAQIALEKNNTKTAREILQDVSKKLAIIQAKYPALALFTVEMEADILHKVNANPAQKKLKQIDDLLNDETLQSAFLSVPFYKRLKNAPDQIDAENSYMTSLNLDEVL
jgi:hypothetical protein